MSQSCVDNIRFGDVVMVHQNSSGVIRPRTFLGYAVGEFSVSFIGPHHLWLTNLWVVGEPHPLAHFQAADYIIAIRKLS